MRNWIAVGVTGVLFAGIGMGVWSWLRSRDEVYDDDREIAMYAARPPREVTVPDDVELVSVANADPVDPTLLDVSLGKTTVRVHGRVASTISADGGIGPANGLILTDVAPMLDWGRKLPNAVGVSPYAANVLVDREARYDQLVSLLYTMGQHEISEVRFIARTPSGLGVVDEAMGHGDGARLNHVICLGVEGVRVLKGTRFGPKAHVGAGCVVDAPGVVAGWTATGFDGASYSACFAKIEGYPLESAAAPAPRLPVVVTASRELRFGQVLQARVTLESIGVEPIWGMSSACDQVVDASAPLPSVALVHDAGLSEMMMKAFDDLVDAGAH